MPKPTWVLVACLCLTVMVVFALRPREPDDFGVYRTAGLRALAGESLYRVEDGHLQFKYFPVFALLMSPFAVIPVAVSRAIWLALSLLAVIALVRQSVALLPQPRHTACFLAGFTALAMGKFYARELELGQTNILLAVAVLWAVAAMAKKRDVEAGVLLAAATVVKPYALLFLPYLLLRRRFRIATVYAATVVVALLLPAFRYGIDGNLALLRAWVVTVTASTVPNLLGPVNVSIAGMFAGWLGVGPVATWLTIGVTLILLAACARAFTRTAGVWRPEYLDASILLLLIPLLSPQGWDYVLLLSTPVVMILIDRIDAFARPLQWLLVACLAIGALSIWDLIGQDLFRAVMISRLVTVCALIEFGFALRLRQLRAG